MSFDEASALKLQDLAHFTGSEILYLLPLSAVTVTASPLEYRSTDETSTLVLPMCFHV